MSRTAGRVRRDIDLWTIEWSDAEFAAIGSRCGVDDFQWIELRASVEVLVADVERGDWDTPDYHAPPELVELRIVAVEFWSGDHHLSVEIPTTDPRGAELAELFLCRATEDEVCQWAMEGWTCD